MKIRAIITSTSFLIAILFSLSINAYSSYCGFARTIDSCHNKSHIDQAAKDKLIYDDLIFEELETEKGKADILSAAFLLLPFHNFIDNSPARPAQSFSNPSLNKAPEPIFISVRSLRI